VNIEHYTYPFTWSPENNEHIDLCVELPSLFWLAATPEEALTGIRQLVTEVIKCKAMVKSFRNRYQKNTTAVNLECVFHQKCIVPS